MAAEKRPSGGGGGGGRLTNRLTTKCIQLEPLPALANNNTQAGRKRLRPIPAGREPLSHVISASASLSRLHVKDPDVSNALIPFLQSSLCDSVCHLHQEQPQPHNHNHSEQSQSSSSQENAETPSSSCKRIFWLSLDLSENSIGDAGIAALVAWLIASVDHIRLRTLKLYRNCVGDEGAAHLAELIAVSPWPIEEIHLSHNRLGDQGVEVFMEAFIHAKQPVNTSTLEEAAPNFKPIAGNPVYPRLDPHRSLLLPVWVRLEYNYVSQVEGLLGRLHKSFLKDRGLSSESSQGSVACFAEKSGLCVKDPNCSPKRCAKASASFGPLFHLYSFSHQMRPALTPKGKQQLEHSPSAADSPTRVSLGVATSEPCDPGLTSSATERRHSAAEVFIGCLTRQQPPATAGSAGGGGSISSSANNSAHPVYIFPDICTCLEMTASKSEPMSWSALLSGRVSCDEMSFCLSPLSCEGLKEVIEPSMYAALESSGLIRMADDLPAADGFFSKAVDLDHMITSTSMSKSTADVVRTVMALNAPPSSSVMLLVDQTAVDAVHQVIGSFATNVSTAVSTLTLLNAQLTQRSLGPTRRNLEHIIQTSPLRLSTPTVKGCRWPPTHTRTPHTAQHRLATDECPQENEQPPTRIFELPPPKELEALRLHVAALRREMLDETMASISELQHINDNLIAWRRGSELLSGPSPSPASCVEVYADGCLTSVQQILSRWELLRSRLIATPPNSSNKGVYLGAPSAGPGGSSNGVVSSSCGEEGMLTTQSPAYFTQLVSRLNSLIDSKF